MNNIFSSYNTEVNKREIKENLEKILESSEELYTIDILKDIFSFIDLTTLNVTDTQDKAKSFAEKVNNFKAEYPDIPNVAAICVYPSLIKTVRKNLNVSSVNLASVVGGFPASQTFIEVKCVETSFSFREGASEADMVISVGEFLSKNYDKVLDEIVQIKDSCEGAHLKVILETGVLESPENIKKASILAMEGGADFIKTSTGKIQPAATLEAVYIMATAIKEFYEKSGKKIGIKPAGGISDCKTAINYYAVVKKILGNEWLKPELFRIGASSLANHILTEINVLNDTDTEVTYF